MVRAQRLMSDGGCADARTEQIEAVVQSFGDLVHRQDSDAGGGQLDGEWHPVQATTDLCDRCCVALDEHETRHSSLRSLDEQAHGFELASDRASAEGDCDGGSESDGTRQTISPWMPIGSRLVARMRKSRQQRLNNNSSSSAHAATRCSQLSRIKSSSRDSRYSRSLSMNGRPGCSTTPNASATACGTSVGSASGASSTSHTPSANSLARRLATSSASRVLPAPPEPVSVSQTTRQHKRLDLGDLVLAADETAEPKG